MGDLAFGLGFQDLYRSEGLQRVDAALDKHCRANHTEQQLTQAAHKQRAKAKQSVARRQLPFLHAHRRTHPRRTRSKHNHTQPEWLWAVIRTNGTDTCAPAPPLPLHFFVLILFI